MEQMKVKDLFEFCKQAIKDGHGDKNIVISDDNEGNGYHGLFYQFTPVDDNFTDDIYDSVTNSSKDTIILG